MKMGMQKCNRQFKIQYNQQNTNVMTKREREETNIIYIESSVSWFSSLLPQPLSYCTSELS